MKGLLCSQTHKEQENNAGLLSTGSETVVISSSVLNVHFVYVFEKKEEKKSKSVQLSVRGNLVKYEACIHKCVYACITEITM